MVFRPITVEGLINSIFGSFAAFSNSASIDIPIPGVITPPKYSPPFDTASNVVAVPKSTIIKGPPYLSYPATALTILSAPTSFGLSYKIGIPVFMPGPTISGDALKYFFERFSIIGRSGGTTQETIDRKSVVEGKSVDL